MSPKKMKVVVKTFTSISEKEARDLIQMVAGRSGAIIEPIRNRMFDLISKGQRYGLVSAEDADKQPIPPEEAKKLGVQLNVSMKKSGYEVRYIAIKDAFIYLPAEKIKEMTGKS